MADDFDFCQLDAEERDAPYAQRAREREAEDERARATYRARLDEEARVRRWRIAYAGNAIAKSLVGPLETFEGGRIGQPPIALRDTTGQPRMERRHAPAPSPPREQGGRGVQPRTRLIIRVHRREE